MIYKEELNALLGDVTKILLEYVREGSIGKYELKRLASEIVLITICNAYKDKDPFNDSVAINLLSDLLDKEGNTIEIQT